ncbi:MAG: hypothetical protein ACRCWF_03395 [Beijerinckiaceae bacterium]
MSGKYKIEVWSFPVLGANSPVSHRFMVLKDENGNYGSMIPITQLAR